MEGLESSETRRHECERERIHELKKENEKYKELLAMIQLATVSSFNMEDFTCFKCPSGFVIKCPHAWDEYNTDGDCLAEK